MSIIGTRSDIAGISQSVTPTASTCNHRNDLVGIRCQKNEATVRKEYDRDTRLRSRSMDSIELTWRPRSPVYLFIGFLVSLGLWYLLYILGKTLINLMFR